MGASFGMDQRTPKAADQGDRTRLRFVAEAQGSADSSMSAQTTAFTRVGGLSAVRESSPELPMRTAPTGTMDGSTRSR